MLTWENVKDANCLHTAQTMYVANGYRVWKGKYHIRYNFYSTDEWHLERMADHKIVWSAKTAKECREKAEEV